MTTKYDKLIEKLELELPHLDPVQLHKQIAAGNILVVDVREPDEHQQGHIPGSVNLPRRKLEADIEPHLSVADQPVAVYCGSRGRSQLVGLTLKEMGLDVYVLAGGFKNWVDTLGH